MMVSTPNRSVVVGGGIVGLATAVAMAERGHPPIVLEAEDRLAAHQTGHNSGLIHSGLYYKPGSLKSRTCRAGLKAMYQFCAEENVPHRRCGKLVVAVTKDELPRLAILEERGRANGVNVRRLAPEEIKGARRGGRCRGALGSEPASWTIPRDGALARRLRDSVAKSDSAIRDLYHA
jgi:L-2-hydroxyglutarate oxidase